jgi:flavin-dependent dehydrogenase
MESWACDRRPAGNSGPDTSRRRDDVMAADRRISFLTGVEATGLLPAGDGVGGVRYRTRGAGDAARDGELAADLVVDAAGRDSRLPGWLAALGYPAPEETVVDARLGYATRYYRPLPSFTADWLYLLVGDPVPGTRAALISTVEGGQWIVTLVGFAGDVPPVDDDGFTAFAVSLPTPEVARALANAEPTSPIVGFRNTVNRLRHYERLARWPDGLVALGDAVCTFNPIYGQGMSVAALSARLLGESVAGARRGFERGFQRRLARALRDPWTMATGQDRPYLSVTAPQRRIVRAKQWYADRVIRASVVDERVHTAFVEVVHMVRPLSALTRPALAARVFTARAPRPGAAG